MQTLEADIEISPDGSLKLLSPLPDWIKPGRAHIRLTVATAEAVKSSADGVEKTSGVNGGDACIADTRIPVWVLEDMRRQGAAEQELLADFPGLTARQIEQAWAYVKANRAEIEEAMTAHARA